MAVVQDHCDGEQTAIMVIRFEKSLIKTMLHKRGIILPLYIHNIMLGKEK